MRVKICGITNLDDALMAVDAGADALGFVFYPNSPRYINPNEASAIIAQLPPFIEKVALFVNATQQEIHDISVRSRCTLAQIHFDVTATFFERIRYQTLRVVRAQKPEDILEYCDEYRLIDAYCEGYGGGGKQLNLSWFDNVDCSKIILAGGLTPDNISEVKKYNFYGVDVSSGVEASRGKKDPQKVIDFIKKAKD